MTSEWDAAREARWKASGGSRVTARVSGGAHDALQLLAHKHGLEQCKVLDLILLAAGAVLLSDTERDLLATMTEHRMSRSEALLFREMVAAQISPEVRTHG